MWSREIWMPLLPAHRELTDQAVARIELVGSQPWGPESTQAQIRLKLSILAHHHAVQRDGGPAQCHVAVHLDVLADRALTCPHAEIVPSTTMVN